MHSSMNKFGVTESLVDTAVISCRATSSPVIDFGKEHQTTNVPFNDPFPINVL